MLNSLFKKAAEAIVTGIAVPAAVKAADKYGPVLLEVAKEKGPEVAYAVKENAAVAVQIVKAKFGK